MAPIKAICVCVSCAAAGALRKNGPVVAMAVSSQSASCVGLECQELRGQSLVLARQSSVRLPLPSVAVRRTNKMLVGAVAMETAEVVEKNMLDDTLSFTPGKSDLLVVGPGVLGSLVAQQWFKVNEGECNVVGQTNTTNRHEQLRSIGIVPVVKGAHKGEKFPYVIFCAPPSGSEDYAAEVRAAAERWSGEGSLLFTSSSALYAVSDNGICDEETAPIVPKGAGPRTDRLHGAEEEILKVEGNVVRLAGLYISSFTPPARAYTLERGAHSYYLSQGTIAQRGDHIVNLIHYEDAASLCVAILKGEHRGRIFLGCDNHPVSRQEIMDAVNKSGKYDKKFDGFTSTDGPLGKRMSNDPTRRATGWKPKYESFPSFMGVTLDRK